MTNSTIIDFKQDTPVRYDDLPQGLTQELAEEARALVLKLREAGLHVLFVVAANDRGFNLAAGDARELHAMTGDLYQVLGRQVKEVERRKAQK